MAFRILVALCAFVLFGQMCSVQTNCVLRRKHVRHSLDLLGTVAGLFPRECLGQRLNMKFPTSSLQANNTHQNVSVAKAVYKIMEHIDSLFANDSYPKSWDQKKVDHFQHLIYRITKDYRCIMRRTQRPSAEDFPARYMALKIYFENLATLLRDEDNSFCSWEVVREELLHVLRIINKLKPFKR
ncbi:hypothetical protein DNTS_031522 [Danionella cerebrum]|uniref:Uncharacterized protein n=1 Tax=Danionella cerebrum TaxID=2873325 RepID=A0A553R2R3_9TELE|nr:hypothetical protein DNTS_031522 [Danionella translucida]